MASNVNKPTAANRQATKVQQYVDNQLEKTRRQVKINELFVAGLTWAAAVGSFFLALAIVDAWIVALSPAVRWLALIALIAGTVGWLAVAIVPLFLRKINLNYAAQMIEQAAPNIKNSVLNYTLLRKQDSQMNAAVMDAVSRQAAKKLNTIPEDATVDRSHLIRVGFILVGLMVFGVTYKLVSPRNPLQTVRRVLFPNELISRPASVQINEVTPGNSRVFFGDSLLVSATVKGPHDPADVQLIVSSDDGQITDLAIPMEPAESRNSYQGLISQGEAGIQQALSYRIVARDGITPEYRVTVRANPSIAIETVTLTPPAYTAMPTRTLAGQGDIEAIEGTEAMIHAVANLPIEIAYIELLNEVPDPNAGPENPNATRMKPAAPPIEMRLLPDNRAAGRFNVALNSRRSRPLATHYQLRFLSKQNDRNETPNVYPIRVTPDLAPEIRVAEPQSPQTRVAANGQLPIRIEANDLDFAISSVTLNIDHQGNQLIRQSLPLISLNDNQRVTCQFIFEPTRYRLQPGEQVVFHAVAADNRVSMKSLAADPNLSQTGNFTITISDVDPDANREPPPADRNQPPQDQSNDPAEKGDSNSNAQQQEPTDESQRKEDGSEDQSEDGNKTDQQEGDGQPDAGNQSQQDRSEQGNSDQQSSDQNGAQQSDGAAGSEDGSSEAAGGTEGNQPPPQGASGGEQPGESGSTNQNQENQENQGGSGRNEQRNDGLTDQGDPQGSSSGGGSQSSAGDGASGNNDDATGENSGGSPDGSGEQGPAGTNQDDPNAQASDSSNEGGAQGSESNGGTQGTPDKNNEQQGTRDRSLKDGQRERLPKDAHDGEKFEKLEDLLKDEPAADRSTGQQRSQQRDPQRADQPDSNQSNSDQPKSGEPGSSEQNQGNPEGANGSQPSGDQANQPSGDQGSSEQGSGGNKPQPAESGQPGDAQNQPSGQPQPKGQPQPNDRQGSEGSGGSESPESSEGSPSQDQPGANDSQGAEGSGGASGQTGEPSDAGQSGSDDHTSGGQTGSGAQSGSKRTPQPGSAESGESNNTGEPGDAAENDPSNPPSDRATAKGSRGSGDGSNQASDDQLEKEKADLEHAKKATDLVLNKLEDQQYNPDPDLLDKMNWTEQDLRDFLSRWKQMKQSAQTGDPNAQKQYEEAIKSLGLRPDATSRTSENRDADTSGLNQDSSVIEPPADLAPDFNEFLRDRNRVR